MHKVLHGESICDKVSVSVEGRIDRVLTLLCNGNLTQSNSKVKGEPVLRSVLFGACSCWHNT
eukprot:4109760-Amphidinium_carterae.1